MNLGLTLNVAISLVFTYVLAALLASTFNELISGVLRLRGVYLTKAIESLTTVGMDNGFSWGKAGPFSWFHAHLFQRTAHVSRTADLAAEAAYKAGKDASGLAAATPTSVALAMTSVAGFEELKGLDLTIGAAVAALPAPPGPWTPAQLQSVVESILPTALMAGLQRHPLLIGTPSSLPSYVPSRDFASALLSALTHNAGNAAAAWTQIQNSIAALPDGSLKTTLQSFVDSGSTTLEDFRNRVEHWFDDAMDRLSGIYKRSTQYVMLILGLLIAFTMNIDSLHLARTFWDEPAMSKAISDAASAFITKNGSNPLGCSDKTTSANPPQGAPSPSPPTTSQGDAVPCSQKTSLRDVQSLIDQQSLPIGRAPDADLFGCVSVPNAPPATCTGSQWRIWTIIGWLITGLAISLGAQFWFGILGNLASLRAAGDKPQPSTPPS